MADSVAKREASEPLARASDYQVLLEPFTGEISGCYAEFDSYGLMYAKSSFSQVSNVQMSISLVVFRLEVADESEQVTDFNYTASHFTVGKSTYAQVVSSVTISQASKEDIALYKGRREYQTFTIETFHNQVPDIDMAEALAAEVDMCLHDNYTEAVSQETDSEYSEAKEYMEPTEHSTAGSDSHVDSGVEDITKQMDKVLTSTRSLEGASACVVAEPKDSVSKVRKSHVKSKSPSPASLEVQAASRPGSGKARSRETISPTITFFSGNPSVETTEGILHLYKDDQQTSLTEAVPRSEMICIVKVPASIMSQDLLKFVGPFQPWLENIKIVRDSTPSQYMVLLKFKDQKHADEFYQTYNSQPFNSIESDICHLVYVAKLEAVKSTESAGFPISGLTELPVCPVCLERMDESVEGILTILCNHSFHSSCLAQWGDTSCPVCRYVQTPENVADNCCFMCSSRESLWICLICGHVGCGRYDGEHAYRHFEETNHTYAMQLGTNCVWDYAGDNYVHRLVANKSDGKPVAVEGESVAQEEKVDSLTLEYTYLLTSQLESQRQHFEEKIELIEKDAQKEIEEREMRAKMTSEDRDKLEQRLKVVSSEKKDLERKNNSLHTRLTQVLRDYGDEKEMNKSLLQNQSQWQEKVISMEANLQKKDKEISDLQEQLRDLMFYLEAQQKLSSSTDVTQQELQDGQIVLPPGATAKKPTRKKPCK